jgi:hypothetical protein
MISPETMRREAKSASANWPKQPQCEPCLVARAVAAANAPAPQDAEATVSAKRRAERLSQRTHTPIANSDMITAYATKALCSGAVERSRSSQR